MQDLASFQPGCLDIGLQCLVQSADLFVIESCHLGVQQGPGPLGVSQYLFELDLATFKLDHFCIAAPPLRIKFSNVSSSRSIRLISVWAGSIDAEPSIRRQFISRVNSSQNSLNRAGSIRWYRSAFSTRCARSSVGKNSALNLIYRLLNCVR